MNRITIIGNLTKDPELRTTQNKKSVCSFDVAVNRRKKVEGQPEADFFRVNAWNELGNLCAKYLLKGRKVAVTGAISLSKWEHNGKSCASMEIYAEEVEFLSPKDQEAQKMEPESGGFQKVETDELPF